MFTLESNIPIPADRRAPRRNFPFAILEVGDSFLAPAPVAKSTIHAAQYRTGFVFVTAPEGDGMRVWRAEGATPIKRRARRDRS